MLHVLNNVVKVKTSPKFTMGKKKKEKDKNNPIKPVCDLSTSIT